MNETKPNNQKPQLAKLAGQVTQLSNCLLDVAQLCLNEANKTRYYPGELTELANAFGLVDKRLKLAKAAANELTTLGGVIN